MNHFLIVRALATLGLVACSAAHAAAPLPRLNIDTGQTTVSGLSSGGFMANQLGYAFSSTFKGVGVFAGGPYMCAGHSPYTACMYNASISDGMLTTMQGDINNWSDTAIDDKADVSAQKIFLFVGTSDVIAGSNPMNALEAQYSNNGVPAANLQYVKRSGTAHTFPTDFDSSGNNTCGNAVSPYISNCGYDGAEAVLSQFYGTLNARSEAPAATNYREFDQTAFSTNPGLADTGWVYVPADCAAGASCRIHVALHGCQQTYATIGDKFIKNTGYARWADTNSIVLLFPQASVDKKSRSTSASGRLANPNGCWDWIGWYGSNFAQRAGPQVAAIKAMVDQLASGQGGGDTLPAPTGVEMLGATSSSMVISWQAVAGAVAYNVYRNGSIVNGEAVMSTAYTDSGLAAATTYAWSVAALDAAGTQGTVSPTVSGTTAWSSPRPRGRQ
jgi:poly(3-hydroxybutyrate) depolymerase